MTRWTVVLGEESRKETGKAHSGDNSCWWASHRVRERFCAERRGWTGVSWNSGLSTLWVMWLLLLVVSAAIVIVQARYYSCSDVWAAGLVGRWHALLEEWGSTVNVKRQHCLSPSLSTQKLCSILPVIATVNDWLHCSEQCESLLPKALSACFASRPPPSFSFLPIPSLSLARSLHTPQAARTVQHSHILSQAAESIIPSQPLCLNMSLLSPTSLAPRPISSLALQLSVPYCPLIPHSSTFAPTPQLVAASLLYPSHILSTPLTPLTAVSRYPSTAVSLAVTPAASSDGRAAAGFSRLDGEEALVPASTTIDRSSSYYASSVAGASTVVTSAASESIVALFSFRSSSTVGLACFNCCSPTLRLSIIHDSLTSTLTMTALHEMNAGDVLVVGDPKAASSGEGGTCGSGGGVVEQLRDWGAVQLVPVARRHFNEWVGREMLGTLCTDASVRTASLDSSHYLCVCAAAALLRHVREQLSVHVAPQSLHLSITPLRQLMKVDVRTAAALELIACRDPTSVPASATKPRPAHSSASAAAKKPPRTLFDALNRTRTTAGARLLRSSLLQPFRDPEVINPRLDAVEELLTKQATLSPLSSLIADFNHFDSTLTQCLVHLPPDSSVLAAREVAAQQKDSSRSSTLLHIMMLRRWMPAMQSVARPARRM